MSLLKYGDFDKLGLSVSGLKFKNGVTAKYPIELNSYTIKELSIDIQIPKIELKKTTEEWGLYLRSISLFESFEGLLNIFKQNNEIYFTSIAWDYSGNNAIIYPPSGIDLSTLLIKMKKGNKRKFIGNGIQLWPSQTVVGALNIIILVFECDKNAAKLGERFSEISDAIRKCPLSDLIKSIGINPLAAQVGAISTAVSEMVGVIGKIIRSNGDDYVDLFEGSYSTERAQTSKVRKYNHESAGIELEFYVNNIKQS